MHPKPARRRPARRAGGVPGPVPARDDQVSITLPRALAIGITSATAIALAWPSTAQADGFENVAAGARTAAMGGAAIAGGSDSAMPTLNPAGLALIPGSVLSVSASLYHLGLVTVPHFVSDTDEISSQWGTLSLSQKGIRSLAFSSFPSSIAYFWHLGSAESPHVLAASLTVPRNLKRRFSENYEFLGEGVAIKENQTTLIDEQQYLAALSWGAGFDDLRLGSSLLLGWTSFVRTSERSDLVVLGTGGFQRGQTRESRAENSVDAGLMVGVQYDVLPWLRVGATARSPSLHVAGRFEGSVDNTGIPDQGDTLIATTQSHGEATRGIPLRFGLGLEARFEDWSVALDGQVFLPRTLEFALEGRSINSSIGGAADRPDFDVEIRSRARLNPVINAAVGCEYRVTESNWIRAGLFTDFSALEPTSEQLERLPAIRGPVPPGIFFELPVHRFGASVGWGTKVGVIDTTLGIRGSYGHGRTLRVVPDQRYDRTHAIESTDVTVLEGAAFLSAALDVSEAAGGLMDHVGTMGE
ncbi:MAG: outer membrane protein transport protein [Deltaproteobacteria bacterium]|nr:outer membrane protein transport protein [Deltaproteobacteria bacterium]